MVQVKQIAEMGAYVKLVSPPHLWPLATAWSIKDHLLID
jgi:hypothetical protein